MIDRQRPLNKAPFFLERKADCVQLGKEDFAVAIGSKLVPQHEMDLTKCDYYEILAHFRRRLRAFLYFGTSVGGLKPQQHQLLLAIRGTGGREWATVSELSDFLQLKNHSVVGLINRAEGFGLVRRCQSIGDHRVTEIHLTPRGEEVPANPTITHRRELVQLSREMSTLLTELSARSDG